VTEGGLRRGGRTEFVGRATQLDLVSRAVEAAQASSPQILVIEGEPGIGKTAFVRQCLARATDTVVVEASGDESEANLEFGVVSQLLAHAPPGWSWEQRSARLGDRAAASRFVVGAELLGMLGALQDDGPVIVALDDAQWIDSASAGALLFALRRLYADRVCVLIATRPDGLRQDGSSWSRLLNDTERVQRVRLSGLDGREVGLLAGSVSAAELTAAAAERLREHTNGHPLHLRALLRELPAEALTFEHGPLPAPHSFASTVLAQLTAAGTDVQDLVAAAAVAGERCPVKLAGAVAGLADPIAALDGALAAELLTILPGRMPPEVSFPHPLVRAAVYEDLSLTRRRELHLACARVTSGAAALAHRVAASSGADDALADELAQTGQTEVARGMLAAGIDHLLLASRVAESRGAREAALLQAVDYLGVAGDVPRAQGLRAAVAGCSDSPRRSLTLATLTASAGHLPESIRALLEVTQRPDFLEHAELFGPATSSLAIICAYAGRGSEAIAWARRALSEQPPTATVEVTAKQALALGLAISGRAAEGVAALDSLSASRIAPEPFEAEMLATRGSLKVWCDDLLGGVDDLSAVIRWSRAGTMPRSLPHAYSSLAQAEYRLGRWDDGQTHADLAVSLAQDLDQVWELPFAHSIVSFFHAGRGDWMLAEEHVDAAQRATGIAPLPVSVYHAAIARSNLAAVRGDWATVIGELELLGAAVPAEVAPTVASRSWGIRCEALINAGRIGEAAAVLAPLHDDAHDRAGVVEVDLWRLRGSLDHARGNDAGAREAFLCGQEAAARANSPLAQAALELAYGHFLRKTGRRSAATVRLQVARGLFEHLRARPFIERCDVELAACGVRAGATNGDDYGLTAREQAVAGLVASGMSNREVGDELYLSTKAIEYHLANVFTKVGVRSRHQLASRLAARP
jgi:DNA-binding CsgD family transcriptional regulator/tetratricopeptide (TPR) repeat protein